jgi:hypothetical protein
LKIPEVKSILKDINITKNDLENCSTHVANSLAEDQVLLKEKRPYLKGKIIENLCKLHYEYEGKGITINDLITIQNYTKKKAQRTLKYFHETKVLFTAKDLEKEQIILFGLRDTKPQQYYLQSMKPIIIEKYKKKVRTCDDISDPIAEEKKNNILLEILQRLDYSPLFIHKLQLKTSFDKSEYEWIKERIGDDFIYLGERRLKRIVEFYPYPNGTFMVNVKCSKYPIRIDNESDVNDLYILLGEIQGYLNKKLIILLQGIIPPILDWQLLNCDFNKDIAIDSICQVTLPVHFQMKEAGKVFRLYVKPIND